MEIFLKDDYLVGMKMTIADISCVCDMNTIQTVVPIDPVKYPKITKWMGLMSALPGYHEINDAGAKALATRIEHCLQLNREKAKKFIA